MSRAPAIYIPIVDASGDPVPGGKLYTYETGTTNNKTTWSDAAKSVANDNPIIANAAGLCGPIYMTDGEAYTFAQKDASDNALRSEDGIFSAQLTNAQTTSSTRLKQLASNPLDQGAAGDGSTDDTTEVQAALTAVNGAGVVDLLGLTYRCDSALTIPTGTTLRNGKLDVSQSASAPAQFVQAHGTVGSAEAITVAVTYGSNTISVADTTGFIAKDLIRIYSADTYIPGGGTRGELAVIDSVVAATSITPETPLADAYATSMNVVEVNSLDDLIFENVTFIGATGASGTPALLSLVGCRRVTLRNCVFEDIDLGGDALLIEGCYQVRVENCHFNNGGNGIRIAGCSTHIDIVDCKFDGCLRAIETSDTMVTTVGATLKGVVRYLRIEGCHASNTENSAETLFRIGAECESVVIRNNVFQRWGITTGSVLASCACADAVIEGNRFIMSEDASASTLFACPVEVHARSQKDLVFRFVDNTLEAPAASGGSGFLWQGAAITGGAGSISLLEVSGNVIETGAAITNALKIDIGAGGANTPTITDMLVENNQAGINSGTTVMTIDASHADSAITRLVLRGNRAKTLNVYGATSNIALLISESNVVTTAYNVSTAGATEVVEFISLNDRVASMVVTDLTKINIQGLVANAASTADALIINATNTAFSQCTIADCQFTTVDTGTGVKIDGATATCTNLIVTSCSFNASGTPGGADNCLYLTGTIGDIAISGNVFYRADDDDACVELNGANISNCIFTGNLFNNGSYGIESGSSTKIEEGDNTYTGQSSGSTSGVVGSFDYVTVTIKVGNLNGGSGVNGAYAAVPVSGTVIAAYGVVFTGAVNTGDSTVNLEIDGVAMTGGVLTFPNPSAVGDVVTASPITADNAVVAGSATTGNINANVQAGTAAGGGAAWITVLIRTAESAP